MKRSYTMSQERARAEEEGISEDLSMFYAPPECYGLAFKNWGNWAWYQPRFVAIRKRHHRPRRARATWQGRWNRSSSLKGYYKNMKRFDT